ncbi:Cyclophilin-like domain [Trichophyton rubrum]|nr:Cyclophilin-like domain [Trichophyton rubrum]
MSTKQENPTAKNKQSNATQRKLRRSRGNPVQAGIPDSAYTQEEKNPVQEEPDQEIEDEMRKDEEDGDEASSMAATNPSKRGSQFFAQHQEILFPAPSFWGSRLWGDLTNTAGTRLQLAD